MPWAVLPITGLFLLFGYWLVSKIDLWLQKDVLPYSSPHDLDDQPILYTGERAALDSFIRLKDPQKVLLITENYFFAEDIRPYIGLIAYSSNDFDNLLCIRGALHRNSDCIIAARCNDPTYYGLYQKAGATVIYLEDAPLNLVIQHMKGRHL